MLNQPSNISPDEVNGSGTVDLTAPVEIRWHVSGDSPLTAYQITFYENDAGSTELGSTGKVSLAVPVWGVNYKGDVQFFAVTLSPSFFSNAGMTNGNEYKFLITQWWGSGAADSVTQTTASLFAGRSEPTLTLNAIPSPLTVRSYSITASYSQAQGDPIQTVRWQIATQDGQDEPFLDTGRIWGTGELQVDYDGFLPDTVYSVNCTVETVMGVTVTTGWQNFTVSYPIGAAQGQATACITAGVCGVLLRWDQLDGANGYSIYRRESSERVLRKIGDVDGTTGRLTDYSARSGHSYTYYVFPSGPLSYLTEPITSNTLNVQYWLWTIFEAQEDEESGAYALLTAHVFAMGEGGVREGSFRNNNNPNLLKNFTRYPTRQPETANYLTGSVSGYIGTVDWTGEGYSDSVKQSDALFALSTTQNTLFLLDPKGHFLRIHTSEPVELRVNTRSPRLPQTVTVGWTEVGSTENISIITVSGGEYYLPDQVISTSLTIDPYTGSLLWTVPDDYTSEEGSILSLEDGIETIYKDYVTRSGNGVIVTDGAEGSPVASLMGFLAGTPLPSGKMTAWSGLRISKGGKNLLPVDSVSTPDANYIPSGTGTEPVQYSTAEGGFYTAGNRRRNIDLPAGTYTFSAALKKRGSGDGILVMKNNGDLLGTLGTGSSSYSRTAAAFTLTEGDQLYLMMGPGCYWKELQIEIGTGMSDYEAYNATVTELAFVDGDGQDAAIYGGMIDLTGGTVTSTLDEDGNALSEPETAALGVSEDYTLGDENLFWVAAGNAATQVRYATGSVDVVSAGKLIQTADGNFIPADMAMSAATGIVTATVERV